MIISKFWLKIIGLAILAVAVIVLANVFWTAETKPTAKSIDMKQIREKRGVEDWPEEKQVIEPANPAQSESIKEEKSDPKAEKLYQMAVFHKMSGNSPNDVSYQLMVDCCRAILGQYPDTLQAKKTRELVQEYNITDEEVGLEYLNEPKVKKSRTLRRRAPIISYPVHPNITIEETGVSD